MRKTKEIIKIDGATYIKEYNELEEFCLNNTNVLLFGEFGSASFPSISDLDVFICLEDVNFQNDINKILGFINSSKIRQYLFFHDPLIIPKSLLPFLYTFHTVYNLKLTINNIDFKLENTPAQLEFLNTIWTTFLIGIAPNILTDETLGVRDKLLVLKNICQSIDNFNQSTIEIKYSDEVRNKVLKGTLSETEVNSIFKKQLLKLYNQFDLDPMNGIIIPKRKHMAISRHKIVKLSDQNSYFFRKNKLIITLKPEIFNFLYQFFSIKTDAELIKQYINQANEVRNICNKLNCNYPFISPFGYQFFRNDLKFKIIKNIYNL